jgi:hypothetical protein
MMTVEEDVNKMKGKNSVRFIHCLLFLRNEFTNTIAKMLTPLFFPPQFQHFIKVAELKKALQLRGLSVDGLKADLQERLRNTMITVEEDVDKMKGK